MSPLKILIVDDDNLIGILLAEMLEEMGHRVCAILATETGAINAARAHRPDLMLVDARLRQGSGVAAVTEIQRGGFVPYILMSGNVGSLRAEAPDAVILEKPFREAALANAIKSALNVAARR